MFQNVLMLMGLGAAVVPLVLHLLSRARYRTVDWGAMMFLRGADARQRQSTRFNQFLLVAVRMAVIALLAVALAKPVVRGAWVGQAQQGTLTAAIVLRMGPAGRALAEIIGIAGDVKHRSLDAEGFWPTVYVSAWRSPSRSMLLVVRSQRPDADVVAVVREEVGRLDADVPVHTVRPMQDVAAASPGVPARRVLTATFMGFALLAIVLAGIGLFGVVAHDVASRRAELALRLALGADPMRILLRTLAQGAWMVGLGLVAGSVLSIWTAGALGSLVFATGRSDPLNIALAAAVLMVVGAVAVLPAARRAARTDPLTALRSE
jgi:hypothetical protein